MEALRERAGTEGVSSVSVPPRRRTPWALIAVILVVGMLSGGGVYLANYQPLVIGGMATSGDQANGKLHDLDNSVRAYRYADGGKTYVTVWIFNQGRWGVSFRGVDKAEPATQFLIDVADVRLANDTAPLDPAASTPFRPFSLGPGEGQGILLELRFDHCENFGTGTASTLPSIRVHYRVLGIPRVGSLDLSEHLMVKAPSDANCPQRATAR